MDLKPFLERCPLIAILRGVTPMEAEPIAAALEENGFSIVEVPLKSPNPMESIARLARGFGGRLLIGAGTVMTTEQVAELAAAGGKLIVTPHADPSITAAAKSHGMLAVPGFFTAAEAFALLAAGADALKLFPAEGRQPRDAAGVARGFAAGDAGPAGRRQPREQYGRMAGRRCGGFRDRLRDLQTGRHAGDRDGKGAEADRSSLGCHAGLSHATDPFVRW